MIWLGLFVVILQTFFHWLLEPWIIFMTPIFEFRGLEIIIFLIGIWLFSGSDSKEFS